MDISERDRELLIFERTEVKNDGMGEGQEGNEDNEGGLDEEFTR